MDIENNLFYASNECAPYFVHIHVPFTHHLYRSAYVQARKYDCMIWNWTNYTGKEERIPPLLFCLYVSHVSTIKMFSPFRFLVSIFQIQIILFFSDKFVFL